MKWHGEYERHMLVLLTAVSVGVFSSSLQCGFTFDDLHAIGKNADILAPTEDWSFAQLVHNDFWGFPVADQGSHKSYRPLTVLSFRANWLYAGGRLEPRDFHIVNVALHALVSLLVFVTGKLVFAADNVSEQQQKAASRLALLAAFIFSVHPVHCDAVASGVGRAELLSAVFYLSTICLHITNHTAAAALAMTLALFSKETGVLGGAVCVVYDILYSIRRRRVRASSFWLVVWTIFLLSVRYNLTRENRPVINKAYNYVAFHPNWWARLYTIPYLHVQHFWLLVCPIHLAADWSFHSIPMIESWHDPRNVATFALYTLLVGSALFLVIRLLKPTTNARKDSRQVVALLLTLAMLIGPFVPASNLLFVVGFEVAERVMYLPSIGFCFLLSATICSIYRRLSHHERVALVATVTALLFGFSSKTYIRNFDWLDDSTLWRVTARDNVNNAKAQFNYGNELMRAGQFDRGLSQYRKAYAIAGNEYLYDVALALYKLDRVTESKAAMLTCAEDASLERKFRIYKGLGALHVQINDIPQARLWFQRSFNDEADHAFLSLQSQPHFLPRPPVPHLNKTASSSCTIEDEAPHMSFSRQALHPALWCFASKKSDTHRQLAAKAKASKRWMQATFHWPWDVKLWLDTGTFIAQQTNQLHAPYILTHLQMHWYERGLRRYPKHRGMSIRLAYLYISKKLYTRAFWLLWRVAGRDRATHALESSNRYDGEVWKALVICLRDAGFTHAAHRASLVISTLDQQQNTMQQLNTSI